MEMHLQPKPSVLAERYKFHQRKQKEGESVAEYMATLKKMTKSCEFGTWLEESIRDQFVCGISSEVIRQRLFAEEKLDYTKAFSMAMSMEAAERNAAVVEGHMKFTDKASTMSDCLAVETSTQNGGRGGAEQPSAGARDERRPWTRNGQRRTGWRKPRHGDDASPKSAPGERARKDQQCNACGGRHDTSWCKFSRYVCRVCNKQGHLRRVCPLEVGHHHLERVQTSSNISDGERSDEVRMVEFNNLSLTQCPPIF